MNKLTFPLLLLIVATLSSCFSPPPRLAPGSTVTFINRLEPGFSLLNPGGLLRGVDKTPIPNGSAMMRAIVMEEAARAGVRCVYQEKSYVVKLFGGMDQSVKEAKALAAGAATPVTLVMTPVLLANNYDACAQGGFVLNHHNTIAGSRLEIGLATSDVRLDNVEGKQKPTALVFGLSKPYKGFAGGHRWETASPASRERAVQVMALIFRSKVAGLFGNPSPMIPDDLRDEATQL